MSRVKVLVSIHADVLAVIDKRAAQRCMTRSGYIAASAMGLIDHARNPDGTIDFFVDEPIVSDDTLKVEYQVVAEPQPDRLPPIAHPFRDHMDAAAEWGLCVVCGLAREHPTHAR